MLNFILFCFTFLGFHTESDSTKKQDFLPNHSIIREKQTYIIGENFDYTIKKETTLKILTRDGLDHAFTSLFYDKLVQVKDFQLEATDLTTGKVIEKAKLKDMTDAAIYSSSSIFDDNRHKYYMCILINARMGELT